MRHEHEFYILASLALASAYALTPDHEYMLWAGVGTLMGSFLASYSAIRSKMPRIGRMVIAFVAGLILAPWFIGYIPKPANIHDLVHVFGSSGIAAACGYLIFTEYPKIVLDRIRAFGYGASFRPGSKNDNDSGDGTSSE